MEWFNENATTLIAAGSALISALIAGTFAILGTWLNNKNNMERLEFQLRSTMASESRKISLEKAEELHSLLTTWSNTKHAHYLAEKQLVNGMLSLEGKNNIQMDYPLSKIFIRLHTLINIYFPELYEELYKARSCIVSSGEIGKKFDSNELEKDYAITQLDFFENSCDESIHKMQGILIDCLNSLKNK
ncbi:hypothetical protein AB6I73_000050 [Citrobacter amalonaticus]|uniref:hypothetical protein n=1 Tax=Citrobacter TaxID=544 RepID=UPI001C7DDCB3|nr:hypothetical protein [Citrobacter amalonaticus]QZA38295.1 hypothetical protein K1713_10035 [Citrobacter amalonaticus]